MKVVLVVIYLHCQNGLHKQHLALTQDRKGRRYPPTHTDCLGSCLKKQQGEERLPSINKKAQHTRKSFCQVPKLRRFTKTFEEGKKL